MAPAQSPLSRRAAKITTRIASTPAAIAATSGSREGSGPISGTGAGPLTGLLAVDTVAFDCAAASFAAVVRSPLGSARFAGEGVFFGVVFFAVGLFAGLVCCDVT